MKLYLTFLKHSSNIVWSSNLVALQPVDGESQTPVKGKFFESTIEYDSFFSEGTNASDKNFGKDVEFRHFSCY